MRKLFIAALALGAMVACNNGMEEVATTPANGESALLKVNLKAAGEITRAGVVDTYKAGSADENAVAKVDFYFFNADGTAYDVDGNDNNFLTVTAPDFTEETAGTATNVESVSDVILVIKGAQKQLPTQMVAIVNDPVAPVAKSLSQLEADVEETLTNGTGEFVMSNSVYMDGNVKVTATQILPENIFTTAIADDVEAGDAIDMSGVNPIYIYVERLAAKVEVKLVNDGLYDTGATYNGQKVYAKVLGWGVTNNTAEGYLIKSVDPAWVTTAPFTGWNKAENFRSYWATTTATPAHNLSFNALMAHNGAADYYFENTKPSATENSVTSGAGNQTPQILVAAQLVVKEATAYDPINLGEWYGVQYTISDLQTVMINTVTSKLFKKADDWAEDNKVYISVTADDVVFYQMPETTADNRYEVKVKAKADDTFYFNAAGESLTAAQATAILDTIEPAKMWTEGYTYYYTDIQHYGNKTGIVRNHWYEINLKAIKGLGTPVYDPKMVITPEIPDEDDAAHLAAQINILSWAMVSQDVSLGK